MIRRDRAVFAGFTHGAGDFILQVDSSADLGGAMKSTWFSIAVLLTASTVAGGDALAQSDAAAGEANTQSTAGGGSQDLAEVIVTAEKRTERLADVPLSITAATGDQLIKQGVNDPADLEKVVPGFTYRLSQNGTPVSHIRGVGFYDEQVAVAPAVTIYIDQVPLPYGRMTEGASLDLERVEVLKGPQGTLFGQNSTGGAVNYIAAKPTSSFAAGGDLAYGRFNEVDVGGFVSGPVATGLNARLAVRSETRDDWQVSNTRNDTIGKRNTNRTRRRVKRGPTCLCRERHR